MNIHLCPALGYTLLQMKRLLIVGSLAYDRIMTFPGHFRDHFVPDQLHNISVCFPVGAPSIVFGGTAGNIAYNLSMLGASAQMLAKAGNDFAAYEERLKENGIATTTVEVFGDIPTASAYITTDQGNNQITAFSAAADARSYSLDVDMDDVALAIVAPTGADDMRAFPARFKEANVPYLFDPGQQLPALAAEDLRASISGSRGLLVNDYELSLVLEKTGWDEDRLLGETELLIVTLGEAGSRIRTHSEEIHVEAVPAAQVIDPTGAGDAYRAGLMHGLVSGLGLKESAQIASTVATYAVECYGTQNHRFTIDELTKRYETSYGTPFPL